MNPFKRKLKYGKVKGNWKHIERSENVNVKQQQNQMFNSAAFSLEIIVERPK